MSLKRAIPITCLGCGTHFLAIASVVRKRGVKYCSLACFNSFGSHGYPVGHRGTAEERFWRKVDKTPGQGPKGECWTWIGSVNHAGYGHFSFNGKCEQASRVAWMLQHGPIPPGLHVLHHCDNPPCVRCLFLGNDLDNARDREAKGRTLRRKLTEPQVREIKARIATGELPKIIATDYGVTAGMIQAIRRGDAWDHIV